MALYLLGYVRRTVDLDTLLSNDGLESFRERLVGSGYVPAFGGVAKSFRDAETGLGLPSPGYSPARLMPIRTPRLAKQLIPRKSSDKQGGAGGHLSSTISTCVSVEPTFSPICE